MPKAIKEIPPPMEQTPTNIDYQGCESRDTQRLSSNSLHSMLAKALAGVSDEFEVDIKFFDNFEYANECTYSYNNTNWYGVYIIEPSGKPAWATQDDSGKTERFHKLWFEVDFNGPKGPRIKEETATHIMPEFLRKHKQCVLKDSKCVIGNMDPVRVNFRSSNGATTTTRTRKQTPTKPPAGLVALPDEVLSNLNLANLNLADVPSALESTSSTGDKTVTRSYLESLSNDVLIDWMLNNMQPQQILGCLGKSTGLTPTETKKVLEQIKESPGPSSSMTNASDERIAQLEATRDKILNSAKNIGLTEEYFDAVKYYCPTLPGLRIEADGGKKWVRSDLPRNKGWVTRDIFKDYLASSSFGDNESDEKKRLHLIRKRALKRHAQQIINPEKTPRKNKNKHPEKTPKKVRKKHPEKTPKKV